MVCDGHEDYIEDAQLERFAARFAEGIRPIGFSSGRPAAAALKMTLRALEELHDALALQWADIPSMPDAVRWLLDNLWLLQREGSAAARELSRAEHLRFAEGGTLLQLLCDTLLRCSRNDLNDDRLRLFLQGFQNSLILEREELSLLSCGLKWAVISAMLPLYRSVADGSVPDASSQAAALFTALRELGTRDLSVLIEQSDCVEQALLSDPAGVYPRMTRRSRAAYRSALSALARRRGIPEHAAADQILTLARGAEGKKRHVGWWLFREPLGARPKQHSGGGYTLFNVAFTLILSLTAGFASGSAAVCLLLLVPVSELVKQCIDFLLLHILKPVHLPRMDLKDGVPAEGRTLCVLSALLTSPDSAAELAQALEQIALLNREPHGNLMFALLADLPESGDAVLPEQEMLLHVAADAVQCLNERYNGGFFLLTRPRQISPDGSWRGWERKRGALLETMRYLRGRESGITVAAGDPAALQDVRFLLVLDSDTRTAPEAALELIGGMLHPLNRPVVDEDRGIVTEGFGILVPRLGVTLSAAGRSDFSRITVGQGGCDPYGGDCSELGTDLIGRSNFAGKGILDINAYLRCMDSRVPDNIMLSHDAVEGAFLRCGCMSDLEFFDGFPGGVLPYYRRMERWLRGDWQNLIWLFHRGRALPHWEKWRLFDSLRRSLVPVMTLAAILAGFYSHGSGLILAAAAALLSLLSELLLTSAETLLHCDRARGVRYRSALFVGLGGGLVRALIRLLLLPAEAWVCLSAAVRALWRMGISHRRLLQWQTAVESEKLRSRCGRYLTELWSTPALGLLLVLTSPGIIGKTAGVLWMLGPLSALLLSLPAEAPVTLKSAEREYLSGCAESTWQFFTDQLTEADHFLPPDNVQVQPPAGTAHRTSPTNIGMALLSVLAAMDLHFCSAEAGLALLRKMLDTVEALPKWHGHLYNWYQTQTCRPMEPRYVSTVDSGNLCACLTTLAAGLSEYGANADAGRASSLAEAMDFSLLYDARRKLFRIGRDVSKETAADSWYDLMASEARLTAYLAVARGDVPKELWQQLSRAQKQLGNYRGMVSWTGTMFEYLMPELLLPLKKNSLLWESARFCLSAQRRRVRGTGEPWGISESAFWSLDPGMNYRYKAHGCGRLALKRGMDEELVISPYSSFLALSVRPHSAIANLRALENRGMRGKWGFWEALDCTGTRLSADGKPRIVRCVMAHHAGMSLIAAANLLDGERMRRRFLQHPAMRAYALLLEERVPVGGDILRKSEEVRDRPRKPPVPAAGLWEQRGSGIDFRRPACCLLSGETYSLLITESGITRPLWGGITPYLSPRSPLDSVKGIELYWEDGNKTVPLLPDAYGDAGVQYDWMLSTERAAFHAAWSNGESRCTVSLPEAAPGERRSVSLRSTGAAPCRGTLTLRIRPLLAKLADYESHPAFCGLGISAKAVNGRLLFRRLPRGGERELWLCMSFSRPCTFDLDPAADVGRPGKLRYAGKTEYFLTRPLATIRCPMEAAPGESAEFRFALSLAYSEAEALESAGQILHGADRADLPRSAAKVLGITAAEIGSAFSLLPELCFPTAPAGTLRQEALWPLGISGDLPILCARYGGDSELSAAKKLMDTHLFLCGCGCAFDLVFLSVDGADYRRPLRTALSDALWRAGGELLRDARGGVHLVEDNADAAPVCDTAVRLLSLSDAPAMPERRVTWRAALPAPAAGAPHQVLPRYEWSDHQFMYYVNRSLPSRAWQLPLGNGRFGFLASDCGTGHLWLQNAREAQLTPWRGDSFATAGPEQLWLEFADGQRVSLFAAPEDHACRVRFLPGAAVWEKRHGRGILRTTAFVPPDVDARVLLVEWDGAPLPAALHWQAELLLGSRADDARFCRTAALADGLSAKSPRCGDGEVFYALAGRPILGTTCDRSAALALDYNGVCGLTPEPVLAMKLQPGSVTALVCGCDAPEKLRALTKPELARAALERTVAGWRELLSRLQLQSPDKALDRIMNDWCAYQTLACRILCRCSIYQSGGAYGFRDQLQDAVNLIGLDTALPRRQILQACTRQYAEGDVQHWWHETGSIAKGVRTRCSDDLLWLPWAVCEYVEKTGDLDLCAEQLPYLASPILAAEERDRYESAAVSDIRENVLRHCIRALRLVMSRGCGGHGLLRIGSGDWNDGFDAVGGESQWLSWFFLHVAGRFSALCDRLGQEHEALDRFSDQLAQAADRAWDGDWYLRGYYADGAPLGGHGNAECRIDSIAQSWAVLSGRADPEKANRGMTAAVELLFDRTNRLVKLFDPPFSGREQPGYISCYGPGFRENGGQYTHAALWLVMALLRLDRREEAREILSALLPAGKEISDYLCEPFVIAADVYAAPGHEGEGGWSWYTGSAGWLWRIVTEELLGLKLRDGLLYIEPRLPADWPGCTIRYFGHDIAICGDRVRVDGAAYHGQGIRL